MMGSISSSSLGYMNIFLYSCLLLLFLTEVSATLHKPANRKMKREKLPDKVAYNNKNMPADCEVCKLLVEEVEKIIKDQNKVLDENEEKKKKREQRRTGKRKVTEEDKINELEKKLKTVCRTMRKYLPQNDLTKFRYISRDILSETATLTMAATEPSKEQQVKQEYESLVHPETKRLENQTYAEEASEGYNEMEKKRVLENDTKLGNCLAKTKVDDTLWGKTFDHLIPYHNAMMPDEL